MSRQKYGQQGRGDATSYERYLRGMNQSMRQKVALTAAHLLGRGTVADMGMGSGAGTLALAALYPEMKIVGIDVNPEMVARARQTHVLPNLEFRVGDIAEQVCALGFARRHFQLFGPAPRDFIQWLRPYRGGWRLDEPG